MKTRPWQVAGLAAIALPALWLLLAGPERVLGFEAGKLGMALLVAAAWSSLLALSMLPRGEAESVVAPGEWKAWIGTGFMLAAVAYFFLKLDVFAGAAFGDRAAQAVARNLAMLLVAWAVLSQVVASRWKGAVQEDERDREIATQAACWGRGALVVGVIGIALALGFSPAHRLQWATPFMIANVLVLALMCGWLFECAAAAAMYVRDRRNG
jgi:hypothetical protein